MPRTTLLRAALLAGLVTSLAAPATMAGAPKTIRTADPGVVPVVRDLSARDDEVIVAWDEGEGSETAGFGDSDNGGDSFVEWLAWSPNSRPRGDACSEPLDQAGVLGYTASGARAMELLVTGDQRPIEQPGTDYLRPDVACSGANLIVLAVLVRASGSTRLIVWTFTPDLSDGAAFGFDLGTASTSSAPVIVARGGWVHVAWMNGSSLKYKRFKVGGAPAYALSPRSTVTIETTGGQSSPQLGVDGKRVVLAWQRKASVVARVSSDRGASWGSRRTLFRGDASSAKVAFLNSADVRGRLIIAAGSVSNEGITVNSSVMFSADNGRSWAKVPGTKRTQGFLFAALDGPADAPILHLAWDQRFSGLDTQSVFADRIALE